MNDNGDICSLQNEAWCCYYTKISHDGEDSESWYCNYNPDMIYSDGTGQLESQVNMDDSYSYEYYCAFSSSLAVSLSTFAMGLLL